MSYSTSGSMKVVRKNIDRLRGLKKQYKIEIIISMILIPILCTLKIIFEMNLYGFSYDKICFLDSIIFLDDIWFRIAIILPISLFVTTRMLEQEENIQIVIRSTTRTELWENAIIKVCIILLFYTIYFVLCSCFVGGMIANKLNNWSEINSVFCKITGSILNQSISITRIITEYVISTYIILLFFNMLFQLLDLILKKQIVAWSIVIILAISISRDVNLIPFISRLDRVHYDWLYNQKIISEIFIIVCGDFIMYVTGVRLVNKKEFLSGKE